MWLTLQNVIHINKKDNIHAHTVLIPVKFQGIPIAQMMETNGDMLTMQSYRPEENIFMPLVHVALKLCANIMEHQLPSNLSVDEDFNNCIPDSLYMFLQILCGGPERLEIDVHKT